MPGVVRKSVDHHVGHASPTPNPFHQTKYSEGSPNVFVEGNSVVRIGDKTACADPASAGSPDVFANGIKVHRLNDATGGHVTWVPNKAASASTTVIANGGAGAAPSFAGPTTTTNSREDTEGEFPLDDPAEGCESYNWITLTCQD